MGERLVLSHNHGSHDQRPDDAGDRFSDIANIRHLRRIFAQLDGGLRDVLRKTLEGWEPPQVVLLGQESSGKSSILERLTMVLPAPRSCRAISHILPALELGTAHIHAHARAHTHTSTTHTHAHCNKHTLQLSAGAHFSSGRGKPHNNDKVAYTRKITNFTCRPYTHGASAS